jgi:hypothetical protein
MKRASLFITILLVLALAGMALAQVYTFVVVYSITGTVSDHASSGADGSKIVYYRDDADLSNGYYVTDIVGATGASGTANRYLINATSNPNLPLVVGNKYKVATVQKADGYGAGPVEFTVSGTGYDVVNLSMALGAGISEPSPIVLAKPPVFDQIRFGERVYFKHLVTPDDPFYTSTAPVITANIEGTEAFGVDTGSITVKINDRAAYTISGSDIFDSVSAAGVTRSLSVRYSIPESDPLPSDPDQDTNSTITFTAWDATHAASTTEVCTVTVAGGPLRIIGTVLAYPSPFAPSRQNTEIQYTLSRDAEIEVIIISIAGEPVRRIHCPAGTEGGNAGANKVSWNGRNMINEQVGNGVYAGTIVSREENKLLAKFKVTVFD